MGILKYFAIISMLFALTRIAAAESNDYDFYKKYGHTNKSWNELVQQGFTAYDQQNCDGTLTYLKQAVAAQCQDGLVYFKLAACSELNDSAYTAMQYYQLADEQLQKLKAPHRYQREIYENYGRALFKAKKYDAALPLLSRAAVVGTPSFSLFYMVGYLNMQKGDNAAALDYFNRALAMDIGHAPPLVLAEVYKEVAKAHLQQKDFSNALQLLEKSLQLNPQNQEAANLRSQASAGLHQQSIVNMIQGLTGMDQKEDGSQSLPPPPAAAKLPPLEGSIPQQDPTPPLGTVVSPTSSSQSNPGTTTKLPPLTPTAPHNLP